MLSAPLPFCAHCEGLFASPFPALCLRGARLFPHCGRGNAFICLAGQSDSFPLSPEGERPFYVHGSGDEGKLFFFLSGSGRADPSFFLAQLAGAEILLYSFLQPFLAVMSIVLLSSGPQDRADAILALFSDSHSLAALIR